MKKTINQSFFYPNPPEMLWEYLTNSELIGQWLMRNDFKPIKGHEFQFLSNPMPKFNLDGIMHCKVLELIPNKKLSYTWKAGPGNGVFTLDTIVEWTLTPKNNGTEVTIEHSGFDEVTNADLFKGMTSGWQEKFEKISKLINTNDTTIA